MVAWTQGNINEIFNDYFHNPDTKISLILSDVSDCLHIKLIHKDY